MKRLKVGDAAPDFELLDHKGEMHRLWDVLKSNSALLVFNIGFAWPHCTHHMAQLRHDYEEFRRLNCEVLVMVPNGPHMIALYMQATKNPYPVLSDKGLVVAGMYMQVKRFYKLGAPTVILVDQQGKVIYTHYGYSLVEEPDNHEALAVLAGLAPTE